jgi:hypothetical protein
MKKNTHKKIDHEIAKEEEECVMVKKSVVFKLLNSGENNRRFKRHFYILAFIAVILVEVIAMFYLNTKIEKNIQANMFHISSTPSIHESFHPPTSTKEETSSPIEKEEKN